MTDDTDAERERGEQLAAESERRRELENEDRRTQAEKARDAVNPPAGDVTDTPYDTREVRDLLGGAELLRYSEGTGEHAGNVMAVFRTPDGEGVGLTFRADPSTFSEDLIGERVREERGFVVGSGTSHGKAFVLFEDRNAATDKITIRNTQAVGLYEVDL